MKNTFVNLKQSLMILSYMSMIEMSDPLNQCPYTYVLMCYRIKQ